MSATLCSRVTLVCLQGEGRVAWLVAGRYRSQLCHQQDVHALRLAASEADRQRLHKHNTLLGRQRAELTQQKSAMESEKQQLLHTQLQLQEELKCMEVQMLDASEVCDDYAQASG